MRKLLLFLTSLFIISAMTTCEIGLGSADTPENIFTGGEWQIVDYKTETVRNPETGEYTTITTDTIHYIKKLSFAENTFAFYEMQDSPHRENTYTGTYSLSYGDYQRKLITFVSSEPSINGTAIYHDENNYSIDERCPDGTVRFIIIGDTNNPINGLYLKTN